MFSFFCSIEIVIVSRVIFCKKTVSVTFTYIYHKYIFSPLLDDFPAFEYGVCEHVSFGSGSGGAPTPAVTKYVLFRHQKDVFISKNFNNKRPIFENLNYLVHHILG